MLVTVCITTAPLTVMVCTLVIGVAAHVGLWVCVACVSCVAGDDVGDDAGAEVG
jgi:hypothetical protein